MANQRPLFLISTGRSGSTLVQRVINCHKGAVVWGEHFGFLDGVGQAFQQMKNAKYPAYSSDHDESLYRNTLFPTFTDPSVGIGWINPLSFKEFRCHLKSFIEGYFSSQVDSKIRWGFKEIRYNNFRTLSMFRDLFPGGSFIFVKRDLVDVVRSKIYAFVKEDRWSSFSAEQQDDKISNLINQVLRDYNVYRSFSERYPDGCHVIQYEDLLKDPEVIVGRLLDDLDLDRDGYDWERLKSVMNTVLTSTKRDEELSDRIRNLSRTAL